MVPLDDSNPKIARRNAARVRDLPTKDDGEVDLLAADTFPRQGEVLVDAPGDAGDDTRPAEGDYAFGAGQDDGGRLGTVDRSGTPAERGNVTDGIGTESTTDGAPGVSDLTPAHATDTAVNPNNPITPRPAEVGMVPVNKAGTPTSGPDAFVPDEAYDRIEESPLRVYPDVQEAAAEHGNPVAEAESDETPDESETDEAGAVKAEVVVEDPTGGQDGNPTLATVTGDDEDGPSSQTPTVTKLARPENGRSKELWFDFAKSVDLSEGKAFAHENNYEGVTKAQLIEEYGDR
jgi:hypothetical protein